MIPSTYTLTIVTKKVNSVTDFCLFAPPNPGPDSVIGNTEVSDVPSFEE